MHALKAAVGRLRPVITFEPEHQRAIIHLTLVSLKPLTYQIQRIEKLMVHKRGVLFFRVLPSDCLFLGPDGEKADLGKDPIGVSSETFDPAHIVISM